jgi:hypothetical protein
MVMGDSVTLVMYHGCDFVRNEYHKLEYVCGQMDVWEEIDPNLICYFDLINMVKHCGK